MGFIIVHPQNLQLVHSPLLDSTTVYEGSLVSLDNTAPTEGMMLLPVAAGASNTTNKDIPFGVVVGTNLNTPEYNSTVLADAITDATPLASTTEFAGVEGPWAKGDKVAMARVALIDPTTVLRGPIFNAAVGVAPSLLTATAGDANGLTVTTNATDVAPVAVYSTIYFREGANAGAYRILDTTSTTVHAWDKATTAATAIGDVAVIANGLRFQGTSRMQIDATSQFIDCGAALTAHYFIIDVIRVDLSVAGNEYAEFRFNMDNFCQARA